MNGWCLEYLYLKLSFLKVSSPRNEGTLNESNALVMSDGQNVAEFSDEDLYARLKEFGVDVGPIVGKSSKSSSLHAVHLQSTSVATRYRHMRPDSFI